MKISEKRTERAAMTSDNVFADNVFDDQDDYDDDSSPDIKKYYTRSKESMTLGSGGSSNGGLEVFIERDEERVIDERDLEEEGKGNSLKVNNGYRSASLSPHKRCSDEPYEERDCVSKLHMRRC